VGIPERREREEEGTVEVEKFGAEGEEQPHFLHTPSFMASAEEQQDLGTAFRNFLCNFLSALYHFWRTSLAERKGELTSAAFCADCGWEEGGVHIAVT